MPWEGCLAMPITCANSFPAARQSLHSKSFPNKDEPDVAANAQRKPVSESGRPCMLLTNTVHYSSSSYASIRGHQFLRRLERP